MDCTLGSDVTADGIASLQIPLADGHIEAEALVLERVPTGILIGTDACNANSIVIDFPKSRIRFRGVHSVTFEAT